MKLYICLLFQFAVLFVSAQEQVYEPYPEMRYPEHLVAVDSCKLFIVYEYTFLRDTIDRKPKHDRYALEIGARIWRFHSIYADRCDSIAFRARQNHAIYNAPTHKWMTDDQEANYEDFVTNYPKENFLSSYLRLASRDYTYTEPTPQLEWTIGNETKEILNYRCLSAHCDFRGRRWNIWFAPELPVNAGPWKLSGLPGLILEATDAEGIFSFKAELISSVTSRPIYIYDKKQARMKEESRQTVRHLLRKRWEDPVSLQANAGIRVIVMTNNNTTPVELKPGDRRFRYIPELELE